MIIHPNIWTKKPVNFKYGCLGNMVCYHNKYKDYSSSLDFIPKYDNKINIFVGFLHLKNGKY